MTDASESFEDEYEEYDEFDDDDDGRGLSGFVVLIMGVVMLGAFFSVVWIAYQQGIKNGADGPGVETPYVAADPEPVKIENAEAGEAGDDREVYDVFDGDDADPVTVLAEGPEEPIERTVDDPIGAIAADAEDAAAAAADEVKDQLASLAAEDAVALGDAPAAEEAPDPAPAVVPTPASAPGRPISDGAAAAGGSVDALSGNYLVQVGAFGSSTEAVQHWRRMQTRLGDYLNGKASDVERADKGAAGVYHRLRIGPFATAEGAKDYCVGLKERGQDCLIKPN